MVTNATASFGNQLTTETEAKSISRFHAKSLIMELEQHNGQSIRYWIEVPDQSMVCVVRIVRIVKAHNTTATMQTKFCKRYFVLN